MDAAALQATLEREIPIVRAIGLRVETAGSQIVILSAPLAPNRNHKATAFAGSLHTAATLAGWGLLWVLLRGEPSLPQIVLQESTIRFLRPVTGDFVARSTLEVGETPGRFLASLRRWGKARIAIRCAVAESGHSGAPAVEFHGRFVALRQTEDETTGG